MPTLILPQEAKFFLELQSSEYAVVRKYNNWCKLKWKYLTSTFRYKHMGDNCYRQNVTQNIKERQRCVNT